MTEEAVMARSARQSWRDNHTVAAAGRDRHAIVAAERDRHAVDAAMA